VGFIQLFFLFWIWPLHSLVCFNNNTAHCSNEVAKFNDSLIIYILIYFSVQYNFLCTNNIYKYAACHVKDEVRCAVLYEVLAIQRSRSYVSCVLSVMFELMNVCFTYTPHSTQWPRSSWQNTRMTLKITIITTYTHLNLNKIL
jgi:hypothetical protein